MEGGREGGRKKGRGRGISCTVYMTAERLVAPHQTEVGRAGQWSPACPHCRASLFLRERGEETQMGQTLEPRPQLLEGGREGGREGGGKEGRDGEGEEVKEKTTRVSMWTLHVLYTVYMCTCTCTVHALYVHVHVQCVC